MERCLACEAVVSRGMSSVNTLPRAMLYRASIEMGNPSSGRVLLATTPGSRRFDIERRERKHVSDLSPLLTTASQARQRSTARFTSL
jgi:hypothetical protein